MQRGSSILNAHFTGVYILLSGCFSVCSFAIGCGRPEEWDRQMQASTFFVCSNQKVNPSDFGVLVRINKKNKKTVKRNLLNHTDEHHFASDKRELEI